MWGVIPGATPVRLGLMQPFRLTHATEVLVAVSTLSGMKVGWRRIDRSQLVAVITEA